MNTPSPPLADLDARLRALHDHTHSLLVEAGAGTGKTTLLAGRIVMLLARLRSRKNRQRN